MLAITKKPYDPSKRAEVDRYPSGDRKPQIAPAVVFRMREHGVRLGLDPRLGSVLGVMGVYRQLSDAEIAAGFRIAEIVGRYEMLKGMPRRTVASPSYERGFGAKEATDTARMLPDELKRHQRAVKKAAKAFEKLDTWLSREQRELVIRVACENERVSHGEVLKLAVALNHCAVKLGMAAEKRTFTKTETRVDDGSLLANAAVEALVNWFFDNSGGAKPKHFSLVDNPDWKKSRGITATDGRYRHTIAVPLRGVTAAQMDAKLRLACACVGMEEIKDAETGEVE